MSFPANPTNGQTVQINGKTYVYNSTKDAWEVAVTSGSVPGTLITPAGTIAGNLVVTGNLSVSENAAVTGNTTVGGVKTDNYYYANGSAFTPLTTYATTASLPLSAGAGTMAYVTGNNRLYIYNSGWYAIAAVNQTPTFSNAPAATVTVENINSYTTTLAATDPEGLPIVYGYTINANLNSANASINSSTGVFNANFATASGDPSITFTASDGINIATSTTIFYTLDQYYKYVSVLLKSVGSNAQQNNTFIDGSTNNVTITKNGDVSQGAFSPYSYADGYWGAYFNGGTNRLTTGTSAQFNLNATNLTLECWVYMTAAPSVFNRLITIGGNGAQSSLAFGITTGRVFDVGVPFSSGGSVTSGSSLIPLNQWSHLAFTLNNSTGVGTIYIDGVQVGQTSGWSITSTSSNYLYVGYEPTPTVDGKFTGYVSNVRLVKGSVVYTGAFTPPTSPLTAISGTTYLGLQSNRSKDNSTNAFAITTVGTIKVTNFGPFSPSSKYDSATNGGSAFFDGNGDYLTMPSSNNYNCGTGDFTMEAWVYLPADPAVSYPNIVSSTNWNTGTGGVGLRYGNTGRAGKFTFHWYNVGDPFLESSSTFPINCWHHVALTRSGNNFTLWVNGTSQATGTNSGTVDWNLSSGGMKIGGGNWDGLQSYYNGYICDLRLVKGTAVYTSTFTPPTAPLSSITNTTFLMNSTNAGIVDAARKANFYAPGDAKVSTSTVKFDKSIYLDGTGDYLYIPTTESYKNVLFGTGDFTVETWVNFAALGSNRAIIDAWVSGQSASWQLYYSQTSGKIIWYVGSTAVCTSSTTPSTNTWYHVAVARSGTTIKLFINGTAEATTNSHSTNYNYLAPLAVGVQYSTLTNYLNGYVEDVRITNGYARYTANFTAPTGSFLTR